MSTARKVATVLRSLQAARLAEAEALGELAAAITTTLAPDLDESSIEHRSGADECYLSVRQLVERIPYAEQTIRNLMTNGDLIEGEHYFKRRGRVMFSWLAMRSWVEQQQALSARLALPLVRNRGNGRS